ncbi:MAG: hypothetical protein K2I56_02710 [Muribaculaceae bacterium]|nr:hypothetical protein [Muribaculaceae bacterium]
MTNSAKPSRIDFEGMDINRISLILADGDMDALTPQEREYYGYMDMVRGLRARTMSADGRRVVTKAGIIKLLRNTYGLSDWMARRIYADSINFFYASDDVTPRAWSNLYADKLDKMADLAIATGKVKEARAMLLDAARLRGCFDDSAPEIPQELLDRKATVIYTSDPGAMGAPKADRRELEAFIDSLPDLPEAGLRRAKEDAGILKKDLLKRMAEDVSEFTEETD